MPLLLQRYSLYKDSYILGTQRSEVICVEKEDGVVDNIYCNSTHNPDDKQRVCNAHLCPAK